MGKRGRDGAAGGEGAKKKQHWQNNSYVGKAVPRGTHGCMVSCVSGKEHLAGKEAQSLMVQYMENLLPAEPTKQAAAGSDIGALIADEVADIGKTEKQFVELHKTGITGLIYLSFTAAAGDASPVDFVTALARQIKDTKQCKSRLCLRFFPVEHSCNAALEDIKAMAAKLVPVGFPARDADAEPETYNVQYEHRASPKIDRKAIIDAFVDHVPKEGYKVSLDKAQRTILVQLIKSCCTVSFVRDYKELSKFNIRELSGWVDPTKDGGTPKDATAPKDGATAKDAAAPKDATAPKDGATAKDGTALKDGATAGTKSAVEPQTTAIKAGSADAVPSQAASTAAPQASPAAKTQPAATSEAPDEAATTKQPVTAGTEAQVPAVIIEQGTAASKGGALSSEEAAATGNGEIGSTSKEGVASVPSAEKSDVQPDAVSKVASTDALPAR